MNNVYIKKYSDFLLHCVAITLYLVFLYLCTPICIALFLSSVTAPLLTAIERKLRIPYFIVLLFASLIMLLILSFLIYFILFNRDQLLFNSYQAFTSFFSILENIPFSTYIVAPIQQLAIDMLSKAASIFQAFIHYIFDLLLFIIAFYFSLSEGRQNRYWYFMYVPKRYRKTWQQYFHEALHMFSRYFSIEAKLVCITSLFLCSGFSLLQFSNPIVKGLALALLDCIPFFGISLVLVPCIFYFIFIKSYITALGLFLLLFFTILTRQLLETYFWASFVKIKTIHTFFISAVSFMIFGIYGIVVSPIALLAVMKYKIRYERRC